MKLLQSGHFHAVLCAFAITLALTSFAPPSVAQTDDAVFELRTYTTREGRLPALHARFRDHTMSLFEKHGMRNIGYWTPKDKPNTLVYLIAHDSLEAAAASWKAFVTDPEWQKVAADSQRDGQILVEGGIVSEFLDATDYSPIH
ncbi:MAG: NIPSNAP family protein [Pseudomonadales bacterium]|nr:NIPSNAP family protein [Pseudomonadales bacterium]